MALQYGTLGHDLMIGSNTGGLNSLFGNTGNDVMKIVSPPTTYVNDMHGEKGRDILLTNGKLNGESPNPLSIPTLTTRFLSGGAGDDIINNSYAGGSGFATYVSDSRLFDPVAFSLKTSLVGAKQFLEGGHDVIHGSKDASTTDMLQLRGAGWEIRLDDGTVLTAADFLNVNNEYILGVVKSGIAMVKMINSDDSSQNKLHTITFDNMEKIKLFDGSIGGSNTDFGLANSTGTVGAINTSHAAYSKISDASGNVMFGKNVNTDFKGGSKDDVLYAGDGNKTIKGNGGNDLLIAGNGNQILQGGTGDDTFVFRADNVKTADAVNHTYEVWGGNKNATLMGTDAAGVHDWLDLSGMKVASISGNYSNGITLTGGAAIAITAGSVVDLTGNNKAGQIVIGDTTIQFHGIDRIIL